MKTSKMTTYKICMIAFAICINFVGGQIALLLRLPIYLDSIGTVFVASTLGPFYGMLPNLLSGLLMGMTVDVYSLYYAPVGIVLCFVTGLVFKKWQPKKWGILPGSPADYPATYHYQFLHYRIFIRWYYFFRIYHPGTDSGKNTAWYGGKLLRSSVYY